MVTAEDVRRSAKVALILRAGRAGSNPAPGRQVHPDAVDFWGLPAGTTITPGMRRLTAAQREQFQALTPEQRSRYFEARRTGTHAAAIKAVKPAPAKAAKKAVPVKRVLWGSHPGYNGGQPLKLTGGTDREISAEARRRRAEGWDVQVRGEGERPSEGFRLVAEQGGSGAVREASERARKAAAAPAKKATPRAAKSTPTKAERMDALEAHAGMRMDHGDREGALAAIEQMRRLDPKGRDWDQLRRDVEIDMMSRPEIDAELRKRGLSTAGGSQEAKARLREAEKAEHLGAAKATPAPVSDQRIAEAERRAARTRERADRAQAAHDAAARRAEDPVLAEHFPLGTGGAHGGRQGTSDAKLRKYVETRQAAEAAQAKARRAESQATDLAARRDAAGKYSRDTVAAGDYIKVKGTWERVLKANDKTVQVDAGRGLDVRYRWDQVTDHRSAESVISVAADRAGLTGTERADFIAWAKRNPGKTVADWRTQRAA